MMCTDLPRVVVSKLDSIRFLDSLLAVEHPDKVPTVKFVTIIEVQGRRFGIDWIHESGGKAVDLVTLDEVWLDLRAVI